MGKVVAEEGRAVTGAWAAFRADLRAGRTELVKRTSREHARWVLLFLLAGALLRITQLWQGITFDETFIFNQYGDRSFGYILSNYGHPGNHILHTLLTRMSTGLFGVHAWSLRLPALIAGILVLPLFYVFVRAMFNRYIALLALAMAAGSGALVEYSALARGYSLTWAFMVGAWIAGRYYTKTGNAVGGVLVALLNALGMWAVPSMLPAALACYLWMALYMVASYRSSLARRTTGLGLSFLLFLLLTALAYAPVVAAHSMDHLLHHPVLGEVNWGGFVDTHQDRSLDLWAYFNDTSGTAVSLLGFAGLAYAAWISSKYRIMLFAMVVGAVPLTVLQMRVAPPQAWSYILFNLHMSSGIALFYLLKLVQERAFPSFGKRLRTIAGAVGMLLLMAIPGLRGIQGRVPRELDARRAARFMEGLLRPGDRILVEQPHDAAFTFWMLSQGMDHSVGEKAPGPGGRSFALVVPADGQTLATVLKHNRMAVSDTARFTLLKDWKRLELWQPR